jgi:hypothetical protein
MSKQALCSSCAIVSFEVKIMNNCEHLERLFREATTGVVALRQIAIAALDR